MSSVFDSPPGDDAAIPSTVKAKPTGSVSTPLPTIRPIETVRLTDVEMRSIRWVDRPFLQQAAFHVLAGKKGAGKGTWIANLIARATTGDLFGRPRNVLILAS